MSTIRRARLPAELAELRTLLREYADGLGVDLGFQGFEDELATLPGKYAGPGGSLLLAWEGERPVGCVAMRAHDARSAEMKRLYVRPEARGEQLGWRLAERICEEARAAGYSRILLDTLPTMTAAMRLYQHLGFVPTEPYTFSPVAGTVFLARAL